MDVLGNLSTLQTTLAALAGIAGVVFAFWRWARPRWRNLMRGLNSAWDSIVGRPAVYESTTGRELAPALPGIGVRMASTENNLAELTTAVAKLADNDQRTTELEHWRADIETWRAKVDAGVVERVVARAESLAAFRAMEAAHNGGQVPDVEVPSLGEN